MFSKIRILQGRKEPWLFFEGERDDETYGYDIYYRFLISYSLFHFLVKCEKSNKDGIQALSEIRQAVNDKSSVRIEGFLEIIAFKDNKGYTVVDQSNGCCPVIIYSSNVERGKKSSRTNAFFYSIEDVIKNFDYLATEFRKLSFPSDWTENFQKQIRPIFSN